MRKGKYLRRDGAHAKKSNYRPLILVLAMALLVGSMVGGTVAWLIADTDPVVNTFTYGDINLKLEETKTDEKGNSVDEDGDGTPDKTDDGNEYEMIPGKDYLKDPTVTVLAGNEACWLFVKLEKKGGVTITDGDGNTTTYGFDDYLTYEVAEGWTQLMDASGEAMEGIYFRYVGEDTDGIKAAYEVLKNNVISVPGTVTKDMLNALDDADATYPSLSITAYAVQYSGFEAEGSEDGQKNAAALNAWQAVEN